VLKTKTGIDIPSVSAKIATQMRNRAITEFGIPPLLMAESCAFSFAMVVRNALGLSAEGGISSCIVNDSFSGLVVLATARHLINAGASVQLIYAGSLDEVSKDMETQLNILGAYGCGLTVWDKLEDAQTIGALLEQGHNCLLGTIKFDSPNDPFQKATNELLNELNTPIYCFDFPTQVDPDTGKSLGSPLYASATVCAGVLVNGIESAEDYTGRIYVCDSVIPRPLYEQLVPDFPVIFSEQPVQAVVRSS
jgi:NAD(P)H-hydrate repair Nnr-like enzyme with NAD(P)H-hydrate epimerase domain